ncbi:MAG TPA: TonB family protein [Candidatus Baltobacteraceae bacterium]|nr:TonB family protein [Candidatus Baltobacteraceae bacterium]
MNQQRTRRLLLVAFLLSLLIHAILATGVRWHLASVDNSVERVSLVHILHVAHVVPPPHTPPPPPKPPKAAPAIKAPKTVSSRPGGRGTPVAATAVASPTHAPTPAPSPTSNCMTQDSQASIVASPPPPDIPSNARGDATSGTTHVRVDLDNKGIIIGTSVTVSSGNSSLDLIAETMARATQYAPATHACKAIASSYDFKAKFVAW